MKRVQFHLENFLSLLSKYSHRQLHLFICARFHLPRVCRADSLIWHLGRGFSKDVSKRRLKIFNSKKITIIDVSQTIVVAFNKSEYAFLVFEKLCRLTPQLDYSWMLINDRSLSCNCQLSKTKKNSWTSSWKFSKCNKKRLHNCSENENETFSAVTMRARKITNSCKWSFLHVWQRHKR